MVESTGVRPVRASTAPATRALSGPGGVRKASPGDPPVEAPRAADTIEPLGHEKRWSDWPGVRSLNRMLKVAAARAGITLVAGVADVDRG